MKEMPASLPEVKTRAEPEPCFLLRLRLPVQFVLLTIALLMATWATPTLAALAGMGLTSMGILARIFFLRTSNQRFDIAWLVSAWSGTSLAMFGTMVNRGVTLDFYHSVLCWLIAAAIMAGLAELRRPQTKPAVLWQVLAFVWVISGTILWLVTAYQQNLLGPFYVGLSLNLAALLGLRWRFNLSPILIQAVNTVVLLLIGLPLVDAFFRPSYHSTNYLDPKSRPFSYTAAKGDPATFARWCRCFLSQWDQMADAVFWPDPAAKIPVRLRPGSRGMLFDSVITVNRLGFRGKEINEGKGNAYRIVALGESTTFGCTLNASDKPWPELLQEKIETRLHPARPVEVINAGVPAIHLEHNLSRIASEILPLKPDMLISYHGYNGFSLLREAMPIDFGQMPPAYKQRPLKLLSVLEYRLKVAYYKKHAAAQFQTNPPDLSNPLETRYARAYRSLIECATTNHVSLVLANFSMALNTNSAQDVVAFYRAGYSSAYWNIRANLAHSAMIQKLARANPEIGYVDTHPHLDGEHEKFIDLVHLTQEGREQLAENIFQGIRPLLEQALDDHPSQ